MGFKIVSPLDSDGGGTGGTSILVDGNPTEKIVTDGTIVSTYSPSTKTSDLTSPTDFTPIPLDIEVFGDFNSVAWGALEKDAWYSLSGIGAQYHNGPYELVASGVYHGIVFLTNDANFYSQSLTMLVNGDWDNQMRPSSRGGITKTAAEAVGWKSGAFKDEKLTVTHDGVNKYSVDVDESDNTIIDNVGTTYVYVTQRNSEEKENVLVIGTGGIYNFKKRPQSDGKDLALAENVKNYDSRFGVTTWFDNGTANLLQTNPTSFLEIPAKGTALTTITHQSFGFVTYIKIIEADDPTKRVQVVGSNENASTHTIKVGEVWKVTSAETGHSTEPFWERVQTIESNTTVEIFTAFVNTANANPTSDFVMVI